MPGPKAESVELTEKQRHLLQQVIRCEKSMQQSVRCARIILLTDSGVTNEQIATQLKLNRLTVRTWRNRWVEAAEVLATAEAQEADKDYQGRIWSLLEDNPRRGAPSTFSAEQICQIVAIACQTPQTCDRPISHWTASELADEAEKCGIVKRISPRQTGRFLKSVRFTAPSVSLLAQPQS